MTLHNVSYRHSAEKRVLASGASLSMITEIGELSSIWRVFGLFCRSLTTTLELESADRAGLGSSVAWNRSAYPVVLLRN